MKFYSGAQEPTQWGMTKVNLNKNFAIQLCTKYFIIYEFAAPLIVS